jgi:hypothetical protein
VRRWVAWSSHLVVEVLLVPDVKPAKTLGISDAIRRRRAEHYHLREKRASKVISCRRSSFGNIAETFRRMRLLSFIERTNCQGQDMTMQAIQLVQIVQLYIQISNDTESILDRQLSAINFVLGRCCKYSHCTS